MIIYYTLINILYIQYNQKYSKMLLSCTVVDLAHFSCQLSWCMCFTLQKLAVQNHKKPSRKYVSPVPATALAIAAMDRLAASLGACKAQDEKHTSAMVKIHNFCGTTGSDVQRQGGADMRRLPP